MRPSGERLLSIEQLQLLLSINQDLATTRDRHDLWRVIMEKIKPLVGFVGTVVIRIAKDRSTYQHLLSDAAQVKAKLNYEAGIDEPLSGTPFEYLLTLQSPYPWNTDELLKQYPNDYGLQLCKQTGLMDWLGLNLVRGGELIGLFQLAFRRTQLINTNQYTLYESIADQVALAVANILANEEVLEREGEKALLLSLSEDMATIRDRDDLWRVMMQKLQPVVGFDDAVVIILSPDRRQSKTLLTISQEKRKQHSWYQYIINQWICATEPLSCIYNLNTAYWTTEEMLERWPDFDGCLFMRQENLLHTYQVLLKHGGEDIGLLLLHFHTKEQVQESKYGWYKSIGDQVAVAVANILANEELLHKNQQLEKAAADITILNQQLHAQNLYLQEEVERLQQTGGMVGKSKLLNATLRNIHLVAPTHSTVLITGESGTGKELVARAIHMASPRRNKPLLKVNCAALPATLIESELFGHEKGAFTGALERRVGRFELASGGTLFLDEIGELPVDLQAKLLRVLQDKEFERLGSNKTLKTDVRILAATHRNLLLDIQQGNFRLDLYYRLNVFPIHVPSLKERKEDIPLLAGYFLEQSAYKLNRVLQGFTNQVIHQMMSYDWPGNIRELEHVVERSAILCAGKIICSLYLPQTGVDAIKSMPGPSNSEPKQGVKTLADNEREHILLTLKQCAGKISGEKGAAQLLGVPATTLHSRMKKLGIKRVHLVQDE